MKYLRAFYNPKVISKSPKHKHDWSSLTIENNNFGRHNGWRLRQVECNICHLWFIKESGPEKVAWK